MLVRQALAVVAFARLLPITQASLHIPYTSEGPGYENSLGLKAAEVLDTSTIAASFGTPVTVTLTLVAKSSSVSPLTTTLPAPLLNSTVESSSHTVISQPAATGMVATVTVDESVASPLGTGAVPLDYSSDALSSYNIPWSLFGSGILAITIFQPAVGLVLLLGSLTLAKAQITSPEPITTTTSTITTTITSTITLPGTSTHIITHPYSTTGSTAISTPHTTATAATSTQGTPQYGDRVLGSMASSAYSLPWALFGGSLMAAAYLL
jgi:hypothetical protein